MANVFEGVEMGRKGVTRNRTFSEGIASLLPSIHQTCPSRVDRIIHFPESSLLKKSTTCA